MSSIDQVISRSRQSAGMGEHKKFSIARDRAITKMRNFALADPHYFALELIQGAVANGAEYIDVASESQFFALSYVGGGFKEEDISQLFDFLFASKSDLNQSALRQMALGVNALMLMEPKDITIISGDGTVEGTSQITIEGENVRVGTPDKPLRGTLIRAAGLKRKLVRHKTNLRESHGGGPECTAIEERCLVAPVPLLVNDDAIFGTATMKFPALFGYQRTISFDEGDLYGTIGLRKLGSPNTNFRLLTYGVWVQSEARELLPGHTIGGIITFDRLNKTADHAAIVRDQRYEEMWSRIAPYVQQLADGVSGKVTYTFRSYDNEPLDVRHVRQMMDDHDAILCVDHKMPSTGRSAQRVQEISSALGAPILRVAPKQQELIEHLGRDRTRVLSPNLNSDEDLKFYTQPVVEPPPQPWLTERIELNALSVRDVVTWMTNSLELNPSTNDFNNWLKALGSTRDYGDPAYSNAPETVLFDGFIRPTLYVPKHTPADIEGVHVRLVSFERLIWEGVVPCAYPGLWLDLELTDVSAQQVNLPIIQGGRALRLSDGVAHASVEHLSAEFERASEQVFEALHADDVQPNSISARRILSSIARDSLLRLRKYDEADDHLSPSITMLSQHHLDLLGVPVLATLDGEVLSVREIVRRMRDTGGLTYGVVPGIERDLQGLDTSRILDLQWWSERLLVSIIGPASYVRVDVRNLLASTSQAQVRDIALGLRPYDLNAGLLVEHPLALNAGESYTMLKALVAQLTQIAQGKTDRLAESLRSQYKDLQSGDLDVDALVEENRRQAIRHLQWFVCHQRLRPERAATFGASALPLFLNTRNQPMSFDEVVAHTLKRGKPIVMIDGRSEEGNLLDAMSDPQWTTSRGQLTYTGMKMNTFVHALLSQYVQVRSAFDFDLSTDEAARMEATPDTAFLVERTHQDDDVEITLGVPAAPREAYAIATVYPGGDVRANTGPAEYYGVVGTMRFKNKKPLKQIAIDRMLAALGKGVLEDLLEAVPSWPQDSPQWELGIKTLLRYASQRVQFIEQMTGYVELDVQDVHLAQSILSMPLFATTRGLPITGLRLLRRFCADAHMPGDTWAEELSEEMPEVLKQWIKQTLVTSSIVRLAGAERSREAAREPNDSSSLRLPEMSQTHAQLAATLTQWLEQLRPDEVPLDHVHVVQEVQRRNGSLEQRLWSGSKDDVFVYAVHASQHILMVNGDHAFVQSKNLKQRADLAWMLLGAYACINEVLQHVTNEHELTFQRRLIQEVVLA